MLLDGKKLAEGIKKRQAKEVEELKAQKVFPKLAIVKANQDAASAAYVGAKQKYGQALGVGVDVYDIGASRLEETIERLNNDPTVHGIVVQLPLPEGVDTEQVLNLVAPEKDVDALSQKSRFDPPTPTAILWLLDGHGVDLKDKKIVVVGQGRLVGKPLTQILMRSHKNVIAGDEFSENLNEKIRAADVVISATGQPKRITTDLVKPGAVMVDAGTATEAGKLVGDADLSLYERDDIKISPTPGGVGPLTVCMLFANVIKAAQD